jgi:two-component system chemotaxis sensor kinase CheA
MAVVQDVVMELRGHLTIKSTLGAGTTFRMRLPLSLATAEALMVEADGQVYAIPLAQAVRVLNGCDVVAPGGQTVRIDDREIACYALPDLLNQRTRCTRGEAWTNGRIVVVGAGGRYAALAVEGSLGVEEVVIRPLQGGLAEAGAIEGISVLADGTPAYVLNVARLLRLAQAVRCSSGQIQTVSARHASRR